jgi:lipopolysaccharide export LptBFGC system permease protein LptF
VGCVAGLRVAFSLPAAMLFAAGLGFGALARDRQPSAPAPLS